MTALSERVSWLSVASGNLVGRRRQFGQQVVEVRSALPFSAELVSRHLVHLSPLLKGPRIVHGRVAGAAHPGYHEAWQKRPMASN